MKKSCFYYACLPEQAQRDVYRDILLAIRGGRDTVLLKNTSLTTDQVRNVILAVRNDYPELFYVSFSGQKSHLRPYSNGDLELKFHYLFSPEEQKMRIHETSKFIQYMLSHVPSNVRSSEYMTALWLHDILANNIFYDHDAAEKGSVIRPEAYNIIGSIRGKTAVCSGISKLYLMLCEKMGIWCAYIVGDALPTPGNAPAEDGSERHAWNLVRTDGTYAYIDVTWDLREEKGELVEHTYFGLSEKQARLTRTADPIFPGVRFPEAPHPNPCNFFVHRQAVFSNYKQMKDYLFQAMEQRRHHVEFRLDIPDQQPEALFDLAWDQIQKMKKHPDLKTYRFVRQSRVCMATFHCTFIYKHENHQNKEE